MVPILSIDWCRCTDYHRAATFDFWMASLLGVINELHSSDLMVEHAEFGLESWLETWRVAS